MFSQVFEVNSSSKRSGKHILSQLEEATQSHQVISGKSAATPMFLGAMKSPTKNTAKIPSSSPLAAFLKPVVKPQEEQKAKKSKTKSGKSRTDRKKKKAMNILSGNTVSMAAPNDSGLSIKAASLILFEEVSERKLGNLPLSLFVCFGKDFPLTGLREDGNN